MTYQRSLHPFPSHRERDDESALMHYRARSYDPRVGRFVQKDPVLGGRAEQHYLGMNLDPVSALDPTGRTITYGAVSSSDKTRIERYLRELQFWSVKLGASALLAPDSADRRVIESFEWIPDLVYYARTTSDVDIVIDTASSLPGAWGQTSGLDGGESVTSIREIGRVEVTVLDEVGLKRNVTQTNTRAKLGGRKRVLTDDEVGKEVLVHELLHVLLATRVAHGRMTSDMAKDSFNRIFNALEKVRVVEVPRAIGGARARRHTFALTESSYVATRGFEYFVGAMMTSQLHLDVEDQDGDLDPSSFAHAWRRLSGGR
jgi:RHS repeat-associated protein